MQDLQSLTEEDLKGLPPEAIAALARQMLQRLRRRRAAVTMANRSPLAALCPNICDAKITITSRITPVARTRSAVAR